jgi:hypothetical protein
VHLLHEIKSFAFEVKRCGEQCVTCIIAGYTYARRSVIHFIRVEEKNVVDAGSSSWQTGLI